MMFDFLIDFSIAYLTDLKDESLPTQIANILAILVPFGAVYVVTRNLARRRYRKDIENVANLRNQLAAAQETVQKLRAERDDRQAKVDALEDAGPAGFLAKMAAEQQGNNFEPQIRLSEAFLNSQKEALHRAFATLAHAARV